MQQDIKSLKRKHNLGSTKPKGDWSFQASEPLEVSTVKMSMIFGSSDCANIR